MHFLTLVFLLGISLGTVQAQTPDGVPPANEGVCDVLKAQGVTPKLYGLCVAYCEALDCDLQQLEPGKILTQCRAPSSKILERYNELKRLTDPQMPCVQRQECPCWTTQEIGAIGLTWYPNNEVDFFPNDFSPDYITYALVENNLVYGAYQLAQVNYWSERGPECIYAYYNELDYPDSYTVRSQQISVQQANECKAEIIQQINNLDSNRVPVFCVGNLCRGKP